VGAARLAVTVEITASAVAVVYVYWREAYRRLAGCPETSIGVHDYAVSILWDLGQGLEPVTEDVVSDSK